MSNRGCCSDNESVCVNPWRRTCYNCQFDATNGQGCNEPNLVVNDSVTVVMFYQNPDLQGNVYNETTFDVYIGPQRSIYSGNGFRYSSWGDLIPQHHPNSVFKHALATATKIGETPPLRDTKTCTQDTRPKRCITPMYYTYNNGSVKYTRLDVYWYLTERNWNFLDFDPPFESLVASTGYNYVGYRGFALPRFFDIGPRGLRNPVRIYDNEREPFNMYETWSYNNSLYPEYWVINRAEKTATTDLRFLKNHDYTTVNDDNASLGIAGYNMFAFPDLEDLSGQTEGYVVVSCFPSACEAIGGQVLEPIEGEVYSAIVPDIYEPKNNTLGSFSDEVPNPFYGEFDPLTGMSVEVEDDPAATFSAADMADIYSRYARSIITPASNLIPASAIVTNSKAYSLKRFQQDSLPSVDGTEGFVNPSVYVPREMLTLTDVNSVGCCYGVSRIGNRLWFDGSILFYDPTQSQGSGTGGGGAVTGGGGSTTTTGGSVDDMGDPNPNNLPVYTPQAGVCAPYHYEGHPGLVPAPPPNYDRFSNEFRNYYWCYGDFGKSVNCAELGLPPVFHSVNGTTYFAPPWHYRIGRYCSSGPEYSKEVVSAGNNTRKCTATCVSTTAYIIFGVGGKFYAHPTLSPTLNPSSSGIEGDVAQDMKVSVVILASSPSVVEKFKSAIENDSSIEDCFDGPCEVDLRTREVDAGFPYQSGDIPDIITEINYAIDNNHIIYFDKEYVKDYMHQFCANQEITSYFTNQEYKIGPPPEFEPIYVYDEFGFERTNINPIQSDEQREEFLENNPHAYMPQTVQTGTIETGERYNAVNFFFDSKGPLWNGLVTSFKLELVQNDPYSYITDVRDGARHSYWRRDNNPAAGKTEFFRATYMGGYVIRNEGSEDGWAREKGIRWQDRFSRELFFSYNPTNFFGYNIPSASDELYGPTTLAYKRWLSKNIVGSFFTVTEAAVCPSADYDFCCKVLYNPEYENQQSLESIDDARSRPRAGFDQFISREAPTYKGNGIVQLFINGSTQGNAFDMLTYPGDPKAVSDVENIERFSDKYSIDPRSVNKVYSIYTRYTEQTPEYLDPDVFSVTEVLSGVNDNCDGSEPLKFLWGNPFNFYGLSDYRTDPSPLDELRIYSSSSANVNIEFKDSVAVDHQTNLRARTPVASRDDVTLANGLPYNYDLSAIEQQIQTCGVNQTGIGVDRRPRIALGDAIYAEQAGFYTEALPSLGIPAREFPDLSSNAQRKVCIAQGFNSYRLIDEGCVPYYETDNYCTGYITLKSDWSHTPGAKAMFRLHGTGEANDLTLFKYSPETFPFETCTSFDENKPEVCATRYYVVNTKCCSDDLPCPEQVYMQRINSDYIFSARYELGNYGYEPFPCQLDTPMNYRDFYRTKVIGQPYAAKAVNAFDKPHCVTIVDKKDKTTSAYIPEIWAKEKAVNLNAALFEMDFKNGLKTTNLDDETIYIIPSDISVADGLGLGINMPNYFSWDEHDSDYGELVQRADTCLGNNIDSTCSHGLWNFSDDDNFSLWSSRPELRLKIKRDTIYYAIAYIMPRYSEVAASVGKSIDIFGTSIHNVSQPILGPRSSLGPTQGCNDNVSFSSVPASNMCAEDEETRYKANGHGDFGAGWEHFRTQAFFEKLGQTSFPTHTADTFNYDVMFFSGTIKCQNWGGTFEIDWQMNRHSSYVAAYKGLSELATQIGGDCDNGLAGIDHIFRKVAEIKAKITPSGPKSYASSLSFVDKDPMDDSPLEEGGHGVPKLIIEEGIAGLNKNTIIPAESSVGAPYRSISSLSFAYYPTMHQAQLSILPCDTRYRKYVIDSMIESTPIDIDQVLGGGVQNMFGFFAGSNMADVTVNEYKYSINQ